MCYVARPVIDLSLAPGGRRDRQLLYGMPFELLETRDGQAFGLCAPADYVGWVDVTALAPASDRGEPTDLVTSRQTHAYAQPDFKSPDRLALPHLCILACGESRGRFTETELGWVPTAHLVQHPDPDPVAIAALYLGTPYLWGGNSCFGIDCSGLVKNALMHAGRDAPGDSDLQQDILGETLPHGTPPQRGDLLFWKGHVAWVADPDTLIHANAHHMAVACEPIADAIARIAAQGDGPVTRHARLT
ncbi:C40 family peptidase [Thalassococcus sp. CAU 1522]|uniref:C40 family peptidase n=2 Tax=Thalassococcus arenae TaxID=2851652 RepID=A0ABS6N828_9RHOB|nr:NlpC/P60 family protein [Thalassococcus arenae]MBV2359700.1 C40 family peptidase [Thalassococcus arenae]